MKKKINHALLVGLGNKMINEMPQNNESELSEMDKVKEQLAMLM